MFSNLCTKNVRERIKTICCVVLYISFWALYIDPGKIKMYNSKK